MLNAMHHTSTFVAFVRVPLSHSNRPLQGDGIRFVDGFAFAGASFNAEQVATPQTYANRISLRFLNCDEDMIATLSSVTGQRVIYEFFLDTPLVVDAGVRYTALPVNSIPMIEQIILGGFRCPMTSQPLMPK